MVAGTPGNGDLAVGVLNSGVGGDGGETAGQGGLPQRGGLSVL